MPVFRKNIYPLHLASQSDTPMCESILTFLHQLVKADLRYTYTKFKKMGLIALVLAKALQQITHSLGYDKLK